MIRSTLFALFLSLCFVGFYAQTLNNICEKPTILQFAEGDGASLQLISNGDVILYPGGSTARATFVNQRQGAVKFNTQVGFGGEQGIQCPGYTYYDSDDDSLYVVVEVYDQFGQNDGFVEVDVVYDNGINNKRGESAPYYTLSEVSVESEENTFSMTGKGNYFFSGSSVIACIDQQCLSTQIVTVEGKINAALEVAGSLLVLSVQDSTLIISKVENFEVVSTETVELNGEVQSEWHFLSETSFIGVVSGELSIVFSDNTVTKIDTVGKAVVKVENRIVFNYVSVQTERNLVNFVCKGAMCKKVSQSPFVHKLWDMDVIGNKETVFAFVESDEIKVITCDRFDCQEPRVSAFKTPGVVSKIQVSLQRSEPTIIFSLENGATGILNCIDELCTSASLTRASDYLSSTNFSYLRNAGSVVLYANNKIQSFSTLHASPEGELCRPTILGNHAVVDGEVFLCNALPTSENYSSIYFWSPVVTSVFAQNL